MTFDYKFDIPTDDLLYKSPVEIMQQEVQTKMNDAIEQNVMQACFKIGVNVNKDELLKALEYDRNQFEEGRKCERASIRQELIEIVKEWDEYLPIAFVNKLICVGRI